MRVSILFGGRSERVDRRIGRRPENFVIFRLPRAIYRCSMSSSRSGCSPRLSRGWRCAMPECLNQPWRAGPKRRQQVTARRRGSIARTCEPPSSNHFLMSFDDQTWSGRARTFVLHPQQRAEGPSPLLAALTDFDSHSRPGGQIRQAGFPPGHTRSLAPAASPVPPT